MSDWVHAGPFKWLAHRANGGLVTPSTAAGRALFLIEHPNVHPTTWDAVDQDVRDWWVNRAGPIEDAIREARP